MSALFPSEDCPQSQNEYGTHSDNWYEDEGCEWCGTQEPNLVVLGDELDERNIPCPPFSERSVPR